MDLRAVNVRSVICLAAVVVGSAVTWGQAGLSDQLYRAWLGEGLKRQQAGLWEPAAECFREALRYSPGAPAATLGLARCLANLGQKAKARRMLRGLLKNFPEYAEASVLLARLLRDAGKPGQALSVLQSALNFSPDNPALLQEAGAALVSLGRPAEALVYLNKAAARSAPDYRLELLLGRCYAALRKPVEAEQHLLAAAALNKGDPTPRFELARLYLATGRWLDAADVARKLTQKWPKDWRGWALLGDASVALSDTATASAAYVKAVRLAPADKRRDAAASAAKRASENDLPEVVEAVLAGAGVPEDAELAALRARAMEELARYAQAAALWEQWAGARPEFLAEAARCWLAAGDAERALTCLMRLGKQDPSALQQAAKVALAIGDTARAEAAVRRMLALRPWDGRLHLALAELLAKSGRVGVAIRQAAEAVGSQPVEAWRMLARLYQGSGQVGAAARCALAAWRQSRALSDCELAAGLLADTCRWRQLCELLGQAPKLSGPLRLAAARLAMHEGRAEAALRAAAGVRGGELLVCEALLALGRPAAAVRRALAAPREKLCDEELARLLRAASADEQACRLAAAALKKRAAEGRLSRSLAEMLAMVLARLMGPDEALHTLGALAVEYPENADLVSIAAAEAAARTGPKAGLRVARMALEGRAGQRLAATQRVRLLAEAARWALRAQDPRVAADFLAQAAALKGDPRAVAALTAARHAPALSPGAVDAMARLAEVWAGDDQSGLITEGQALLAVMAACADETDVEAWVAGREDNPDDGALVAAEHALTKGQPLAAVAALAAARPSRAALLLRARAMLAAGRPAEAADALRPLMGLGVPQVHELAGDAAAALGDLQEAGWHYARAAALGGGPAVAGKLRRATKGLSAASRRLLEALAHMSRPVGGEQTARHLSGGAASARARPRQ